MHGSSDTLIEAVMNMDEGRVRALVEGGADIDAPDRKQQTPLILAAKTDQFRIAEYLIGKGANILAASKFGWTVGYAAQSSKLVRGPEAEARDRVLDQLRRRGFPFPAAEPAVVAQMLEEKRWPPV
jgi:ankyrin repeat protein